jgi:hypothetical protein
MRRLIFTALILFAGTNVHAGSFAPGPSAKKIITILVNEKNLAFIGRDTLLLQDLATELQKRLWKSYTGTGKMYDAIHLQYSGEVVTVIKDAAIKAIQLAQKNALTDICLEMHKKLFDTLSKGQQRRIKKQFPVLFQLNYQ